MKNKRVYQAVATAIDECGKKHGYNGREHIAQKIGLHGKNADKQLSAILNTTSYDPTNPKQMKLDQFINIAYELDDKGALTMLNALAGEFGYMISKASQAKKTEANIEPLIAAFMEVGHKHGETSSAIMNAIKDGELDDTERIKLTKQIFKHIASMQEMLEALS